MLSCWPVDSANGMVIWSRIEQGKSHWHVSLSKRQCWIQTAMAADTSLQPSEFEFQANEIDLDPQFLSC